MEQTLKGKTRAYRKACRAVGMLPDTLANQKSKKKKLPAEGPFTISRGGKVIPASEVVYEGLITQVADPAKWIPQVFNQEGGYHALTHFHSYPHALLRKLMKHNPSETNPR